MPMPLSTALERYKGDWNDAQVTHLLRRTQFGAKREDVAYFVKKGRKKTLRALLEVKEETPAPPVNHYNDDKYTDPDVSLGATWVDAVKYDGMNNGRRKNSYKDWWIGLMLNQDRTLREKMVLFWHNHFVTETNTVDNARFCYQYNTTLRKYALGNFRDLVKAITVEPAMLRYLNGYVNTKKAPDENYGRELQELFTVGKGPGSHYTEPDVKAAARVLTGYRIDYKTYTYHFDPKSHDDGDKVFSSFYGGTVIKSNGEQELDDLIGMIFEQQEVSRFICRKLYRFFVYHDIDEETEKRVIEPLAATFRAHHYEIRPVLAELFGSAHFFDAGNRGSMIKSPVDFAVGLCREYGVAFPGDNDFVNQYGLWEQVRNQAAGMSQNIGDPPNVAGWQAYYEVPEFDKLWISSDTLPKRNILTDRMLGGGFAKNGEKAVIDVVDFASRFSAPQDPNTLIDESVRHLLAVPLSDEQKGFLKTAILLNGLTGEKADHYWTTAWETLGSKPDDKSNKAIVTNKLRAFYKYLMNMPEYQLC